MQSFAITVNGVRQSITENADMSLLWVLRDVLAVTGTK
jgi:aerobic-type carbon monoxide dehydrogenase small subunit (CoxS/CutS family)